MKKNGKTLVVLTPGFPENEADTTCLPFLQTHIHALNKKFPDLEIIIVAFQYPYMRGTYKWFQNEVISFGGKEKGKGHRLLLWVKVWRLLSKLKKSKNIIGLFSLWCTECALMGSKFGNIYHLKHYTWLCGQDAKKSNKYVKFIRPKGSELIAMSDFLKREFYKNHHIEPRQVIPIGVDPAQFSTMQFERNIDILGAGSLIPLKQYNVFVDVVSELREALPDVKVILCGQGEEQDRLQEQIDTLQLQNKICLFGEVPHAEVLQLMQRSRIFLHTSNYEGFGTVCLEALHAGAHVVSFTKPMDVAIPHWHHVNNEKEMIMKVKEILCDPTTSYDSVTAYTAEDVAIAMMKLFDN